MYKPPISTVIAIATTTLYLLIVSPPPPPKSHYHALFTSSTSIFSSNASIAHHLHALTLRPHIAGSQANADAATYVLHTLTSYDIPTTRISPYHTALTYPLYRSLTLTTPNHHPSTIAFTLEQETYEGDPYADVADEVEATFHAYAKSGTAVGPVAYVNYGRVEDYEELRRMGVDNVSGCVAVARYGKIYRGDIVENAQAAGAVGVLIYTDRNDYGGGGDKWFPDGRWMPPSGVQVGSVYNGAGDPSTPGWASTEGCERLSEEEVERAGDVPLVPSLPVSWRDGEVILGSVGGQVAPEDWQGGGELVYRVGPGPGIVNLTYQGKQVITTIQNVIGIIEGAEEPDRYVILGNHRDAWTFGAVDPNSGTACLLEVAQRMWKLQKKGWKPRRTIIFANWDAEEYGLVGSTEWVEDNRQMLASRVVAYLNVDSAVAGPGFEALATPQLDQLLVEAAKQVLDPDNSSQTIYDSWTSSTGNPPTIGRLGGGGSDYAAFVQHIGVPAADIAFGGGYPVYHSMYDDFVWMKKFGDPMFQRHVAVTSIWGLVALKLADEEILPFNYLYYAHELQKSAEELKGEVLNRDLTIAPLFKSINKLKAAAIKIHHEIKALEGNKHWSSIWRNDQQVIRELNDRLMMAERAFTDRDRLPGRPWYKHLIYGPSKHNDYGSKSFPGIDDAMEKAKSLNTSDSWRAVQHEIWRVSRVVTQASLCLKGELT